MLEHAADAHDPNTPYIGVAATWESLRGTARFTRLLQRLKLPS